MNKRSSAIAIILAIGLVGAVLATPMATAQGTGITARAADTGPDGTYENAYGQLVLTHTLVPSAGRFERRVTFTSSSGEQVVMTTDIMTGEIDVVLPSGSMTLHFLPHDTGVISVAGRTGPTTSAIVSKDAILAGADETTLATAMRNVFGPSTQLVSDFNSFAAAEGVTTTAQRETAHALGMQAHALWASGSCNLATLGMVSATLVYIGSWAEPINWWNVGGAWTAMLGAYTWELTACNKP